MVQTRRLLQLENIPLSADITSEDDERKTVRNCWWNGLWNGPPFNVIDHIIEFFCLMSETQQKVHRRGGNHYWELSVNRFLGLFGVVGTNFILDSDYPFAHNVSSNRPLVKENNKILITESIQSRYIYSDPAANTPSMHWNIYFQML